MSSETTTTPSEDKKPVKENKDSNSNDLMFAIIPKDSIKLMSEAGGYADLPDDVLSMLSEDVTYRLREVAMTSTQFMKHSKRRKLVAEDFNKALRQMDVQPVYGHGSGEAISFRQTREGDIHFVEDVEVNFCDIALGRYVPKSVGETTIKADWLAVEGTPKTLSLGKIKKELSEEMLNYYNNITNALLNTDPDVRKVALDDLRTNPNIGPLLSYFVNYVCYGVKSVSHDISKLSILLHTVTSLINNPHLDLSPTPYLNLLVQALMYNLTEPAAASFNNQTEHWSLRDYASRLLGDIVRKWSNTLNHLLYNTVKELKDVLFDLNKPFCSHYGAVVGLIALGTKTVECVLIPNLSTFWSHLNMAMEDTSIRNALVRADAYKVYGALLLAAELLIKKKFEEFKSDNKIETTNECDDSNSNFDNSAYMMIGGPNVILKSPCELYRELYEYFGDSLTQRADQTSTINFKEIYPVIPDEKLVSLSDADGLKSGEELLEEFMEQVRVQEIIDREKKIEEEKQRAIREKEQKLIKQQKEAEDKRRRQLQALFKQKQEEEMARHKWEEEKARRHELEELKQKEEAARKERERRKRQERRKREEERRRIEEEQRKEELLLSVRQPRREGHKVNYKEDDDEIDVEADDDSDYVPDRPVFAPRVPDHSDNTDEYHSDGQIIPVGQAGPSQESIALTSTITNPGGGIKIKIKRHQIKSDDMDCSSHSGTPERKEKKKRKRKSFKSDSKVDPFEFEEKSDTDDYTQFRPTGATSQHYYSPATEDSCDSDTAFRKSKLTLKLKVPSPHLSDSNKK